MISIIVAFIVLAAVAGAFLCFIYSVLNNSAFKTTEWKYDEEDPVDGYVDYYTDYNSSDDEDEDE